MTPVDPEDRLREILRAEAEHVVPAGDGLSRIQERVAARRSRRRWLVPVSAAATLAVVVAGGVGYLATTGHDDEQRIVPGTTQSASPSPSTASPSPSTSPTAAQPAYPANAIYPYTSAQQVSNPAAAADPVKVAQAFVADYLGMAVLDRVTGKVVETDRATVIIGRQLPSESRQVMPATRVRLVRWEPEPGTSVWLVTGADTDYLSVTSPTAGAGATSPLAVSGRITGVDESIRVEVRDAPSGKSLGSSFTGGGGESSPWTQSVKFTSASTQTGAVVAWTSSALDGAPARVVVVPVRFGGASASAATTPAYWVGSKGGRITYFATRNGASLRYLSTPPAGEQDLLPSLVDARVLFVRRPLTGCGDELWTVPLDGGSEDQVASVHATVVALDATKPGDYAYATAACTGSSVSVVNVQAGVPHTVALPPGTGVGGLSRAGDGAVAVAVHSSSTHELRLLQPSAETLRDSSLVVAPDKGCFLTAPAYAGDALAAVELCGSGGPVLLRYDLATTKLSTRGPTLPGDLEVGRLVGSPGGALIGQVAGGDAIGDVFVVEASAARVIRKAEGCYSTQKPPYPCAQDPSW